jgi:hypothetical protein
VKPAFTVSLASDLSDDLSEENLKCRKFSVEITSFEVSIKYTRERYVKWALRHTKVVQMILICSI